MTCILLDWSTVHLYYPLLSAVQYSVTLLILLILEFVIGVSLLAFKSKMVKSVSNIADQAWQKRTEPSQQEIFNTLQKSVRVTSYFRIVCNGMVFNSFLVEMLWIE